MSLAAHFDSNARKPRPTLPASVRTKIGQQLRVAYDHVTQEPLPESLAEKMRELREVAG